MTVAPGIAENSTVKAGDVVAYVGKMVRDSMLHFEMYRDPYGRGGLSVKAHSASPFSRRSDLFDPTDFLSRLPVCQLAAVPPQELGLV
ncbi:MAG: Membrane protein related to metalloendopeptidase [Myxococcaceae bacterium]|nr:Membrane protein related to metalloendopeptidase [Myxococcaceae bacterium]